MNKIIVSIGVGDRYAQIATAALMTARRWYNGDHRTRYVLLTDTKTYRTISKRAFIEYVCLEHYQRQLRIHDILVKREFLLRKLKAVPFVHPLLSGGMVLFIDADTLAYGDIFTSAFEKIKIYGFCLAGHFERNDFFLYHSRFNLSRYAMDMFGLRMRCMNLNSGLFGVDRAQPKGEIFGVRLWERMLRDDIDLGLPGYFNDEPYFMFVTQEIFSPMNEGAFFEYPDFVTLHRGVRYRIPSPGDIEIIASPSAGVLRRPPFVHFIKRTNDKAYLEEVARITGITIRRTPPIKIYVSKLRLKFKKLLRSFGFLLLF